MPLRSTLPLLLLLGPAAGSPAIDFCGDVNPYLPSECQCTSLKLGFSVACSVNFLHLDTIGLTAEFAPCNEPADASIKVTDTKFGIDQELAGLYAGKAIDVPIPGLSLDVPEVGNVGVDVTFDLEGNAEELTVKLGLDACGEILGHKACGHSLLPGELPFIVISHEFDFGSLCHNARLAQQQEAAAATHLPAANAAAAVITTTEPRPLSAPLTFNPQAAAAWALKCWNNQCPSCTCVPQTSGPHKGFCPGSGNSPTCGCTPFVSHALREGGGWKHGQVNVCSQLNGILSASQYWTNVGTEGGRIVPGDVIVMTPPGDAPMGHCCIGTSAGRMTCHNKNHKDVTVDGYGKVVAIWRHSPPVGAVVAPPSAPRVEIAPGVSMPFVNLGGVVSRPSNYSSWLELGGRGLDTALTYGDEVQQEVADALATTKVPREEIFVTTKIPCLPCSFSKHCGETGESNATQDILKDISILGKPVDLVLLHWPCDTLDETVAFYQQLEAALARGDTRAIGVSNFNHTMLAALLSRTKVKPAVNQCGHSIGAHDKTHNPLFGGGDPTVRFCQEHGISYSAYSPLGGLTGTDIWKNPTVQAIADSHGGISPAQVALRFLVQQNITVVTAAMNPAYQNEDMDAFSFSLTEAEMVELAGLH